MFFLHTKASIISLKPNTPKYAYRNCSSKLPSNSQSAFNMKENGFHGKYFRKVHQKNKQVSYIFSFIWYVSKKSYSKSICTQSRQILQEMGRWDVAGSDKDEVCWRVAEDTINVDATCGTCFPYFQQGSHFSNCFGGWWGCSRWDKDEVCWRVGRPQLLWMPLVIHVSLLPQGKSFSSLLRSVFLEKILTNRTQKN